MLKQLVCATFAALTFSASVNATPIFGGDTYADFNVNPSLPTESGYYVWSNENKTEWHVRWTGNGNGDTDKSKWWGSILLGGHDLTSTNEIQFEAGADDLYVSLDNPFVGGDALAWQASAGPAWDGFDFTIAPELGDVVAFKFGSTLFDDLTGDVGNTQQAEGIYFGQDYVNPDVLVQISNSPFAQGNEVEQWVEVRVPEPASLALIALGLVGLTVARKRAA